MRFLLALTVFLWLPVVEGKDPQTTTKKKVIYSKKQEVSFDETNIDGQARTPDGLYVNQRREMKFFPLYKVKDNFKKNVKESSDYLR